MSSVGMQHNADEAPESKPKQRKTDFSKITHSTFQVSGKGKTLDQYKMDTKLVNGGSHRDEWTTDPLGRSYVNPPIHRASTITFPSTEALQQAKECGWRGPFYGRFGTPTTYALTEAFAVLEGGENALAVSSGASAITLALLSFVKSGDHVLVSDGVYLSTRQLCDGMLKRFGVETTYFDPAASADQVALRMQDNTKVLFLESPSSYTMEICDMPGLCKVARARGITVVADNTWGPTVYRPLEHGAHVSINAATKYIAGHSDVVVGLLAVDSLATLQQCRAGNKDLGSSPGADDCYLALRGLRTLGVRLRAQAASALEVAQWLEARPEVARVLHPALPSHPQHSLWQRDFSGASGLFSLQFTDAYPRPAVLAFIDALRLFTIGFSWGGFESIVFEHDLAAERQDRLFPSKVGEGSGGVVRLSIGLEDAADLLQDLAQALERMTEVAGSDEFKGRKYSLDDYIS